MQYTFKMTNNSKMTIMIVSNTEYTTCGIFISTKSNNSKYPLEYMLDIRFLLKVVLDHPSSGLYKNMGVFPSRFF